MKEIDARGLSCPDPVILTKNEIEKNAPETVIVMVDNRAAAENVSRFLQSQSYTVEQVQDGNTTRITGSKCQCAAMQEASTESPDPERQKILVMVTTDRMGFGDDELGLKLMANFLKTVGDMGDDLWRLVFVNAGVKLTITGSESFEALQKLQKDGLQIMVCGTCLDHFNLLEEKRVGQTTNMMDIVMAMQFADKVINI